ncbi:M23 family metallopeptidase [Nostoc sp. CENA67]|uniref:M23 family metallopeptidase n=1 Tax=Amazonocrinis nigriterrae CENA67 TaxID=2794033 RepID=A0A8J7HVI4_9NOST|nr:M23 family metallopeptidase [Amazonocrinis nigriterrae]MBH8564230.1 M23 family metallopeptidase [Amazonocrinis nigriterrae CENA67]
MTQRNNSAHNRLHNSRQQGLMTRRFSYKNLLRIYVSTLPAQSFCVLSSVSFLSSGIVFAQTSTQIDNIVPTVENSQPRTAANTAKLVKKDTDVSTTVQAQPNFSQRRAILKQKLRTSEVAKTTAPAVSSQESSVNEPVLRVRKSENRSETSRVTPVRVREEKPKIEVSQPAASLRQEKPKIEVSQPAASLRQEKPKIEVSQPAASLRQEKPKIEVAKPIAPRSIPEKVPEVAQPANNSNRTETATTGKTKDYNNAYIDPTNYSNDTGVTYTAPDSVVLTERKSGCRTILSSAKGVSGGLCGTTPSQNQRLADSNSKPAPNWLKRSQNAQLPIVPPVRQIASAGNNGGWRATKSVPVAESKTAYRPNRFIPNPSEFATTTVSASPTPSAGTLPPPMAEGNVAPRPSNVSYDFALASVLPQIPFSGAVAYGGGSGMIYPLTIPAPITSLFGWRIHPISGDRRFHAGTDLGAPMGTPILAAAKGQVQSADWMGGYGLAVVINHSSAQQTLYGHMSQIFVQPGQWVEPGTVIGLVGSTGNSTGAHLHFEIRHLTQDGWVAVDSGVQLEAALSQLVHRSQTAQVSRQPGS